MPEAVNITKKSREGKAKENWSVGSVLLAFYFKFHAMYLGTYSTTN